MGRSTEDKEEDRESDFDGDEEEEEQGEVDIVEEDGDFQEENDQADDDSEYDDLADDEEEEEEYLAGEEDEDEDEEEEENDSDRHFVEDEEDSEDSRGDDHHGDDAEGSDSDRLHQDHKDDVSTDSQGELPWGTLKLNQYEEVFEIDCDFTEEEKEDLWFDKDDFNFFLEDCEELAAQMSSDENMLDGEKFSKSSDMIGLEAWTEEGYKKRQKLRLGAIDCVLDEQFAQWDDGNEDHDKIAELYTNASKESQEIANAKALRVQNDIKQYVQSTEETILSLSKCSRIDDDDENNEQTVSEKPKKKKKEKIRPAKPSGWDAPLTEKQERHKFSSNISGTFRQPGRDRDNANMRPTDIIPVDEYVIPSKKKKKMAEKNGVNGIVAPTDALPQISSRGGNHQRPSSLRKSVQGRKKTPAQLKMMKHPPRKHLPLSGSSNHSLRGTSNHSLNSRGGTHPNKHAPKHLPLNKNARKKLLANGSNRALVSPNGVKKVVKKKPQLNTVSAVGKTNNGKNALPVKKKKKHPPTNPAAAAAALPNGFKIVSRSGPMPVSQRKLSTTPKSYKNRPVSSQRSLSSDDSDSGPKKKVVPKKKTKNLLTSPLRTRPGSVSSLGSISSDDNDDDGSRKGLSKKMSVRKLVPKMPKMFGKGDRQQSVRKAEIENKKLREENELLRIEMENKRLREENERLKRRQQRA